MALQYNLANWVRQTSPTVGTGTLDLGAAVAGSVTMLQAFGAGSTQDVLYSIEDDGVEVEAGTGTYDGTLNQFFRLKRTSTFVAGVYSEDPAGALPAVNLQGPVTVRITLNSVQFKAVLARLVQDGGTVGQYYRKQSSTDGDGLFEDLKIQDDLIPILGGDLQANNQIIIIQDGSQNELGRVTPLTPADGAAFGVQADTARSFDPTLGDSGVAVRPGEVELLGTEIAIPSIASAIDELQVYISRDGVLYGVLPPAPGWEVVDTDNADYQFSTLGAWVQIVGLTAALPQDVAVGERIDVFTNLYIQNASGSRGGTLDIGFGVDGVAPTVLFNNVQISGGFDAVVPVQFSTTTHGGLTTGQTVDVFVRRATQEHAQFDPWLMGSLDPSELVVSIPGQGGSGQNNVGQNIGTGEGQIYAGMSGVALQMKTILQGPGVVVTNQANEVLVEADRQLITFPAVVAAGNIVLADSGVTVLGWDVGSGKPTVAAASAFTPSLQPTVGWSTVTAGAGTEVDIVLGGEVQADTSAFSVGDRLYQYGAGTVGNVRTSITALDTEIVSVGVVMEVGVAGKVFVYIDSFGHEKQVPDGGEEGQIPVKQSSAEQDAKWANIPRAFASTWGYDNNTTAGDPGADTFRMDNADLSLVTRFYISNTVGGLDVGEYLLNFPSGERFICVQAGKIERAGYYELTADPIDHTTWTEMLVSALDVGTTPAFQDGRDVAFQFLGFQTRTDLTNAVFPTYAAFDGLVVATSGAIDFTQGNSQQVDVATYQIVTVDFIAGRAASFHLTLLNSGSLISLAPAAGGNIQWQNGTPPSWAGRTILSLHYDGTTWTASAVLNTS